MPRSASLAPVAILAAAVLALVGCTGDAPRPTPGGGTQQTTQPGGPAAPEVKFYPDGSAQKNLPIFRQTLELFSAGDDEVLGSKLVDALSAAGFDRTTMQLSFDHTQTGLLADSIFVSVRIDDQCLMGQVATGNRNVTAVTEPTVGPEKNLCLIGKTRVIDW